jgi:GDPmannose 4,6-dehydratase
MKNNIIVLTGVTGQDGSHMVDFLLKETDYHIVGCFRRLSVPNDENIIQHADNPRFEKVYFDLTDPTSVNHIVKKYQPAYFINFAAQSFVGASWDIPVATWNCTATGVLHILEAIRTESPHTKFYNAGSSEEFGDVEYSPQDEKHPLRPRSPYGAAKAAARHLVKVYRESYNLFAVQGWLFNHEGTRRGEEFVTRKITKSVALISKALREKRTPPPMHLGNLESKRDWGDSEDFVRAVWLMMRQDKPCDYVVASGETHSIREFVEASFKSAAIPFEATNNDLTTDKLSVAYTLKDNPDVPLIYVNPKYFRPAEVKLLLGDPSRIEKDLGWSRDVSFEKLVDKMTEHDILTLSNTL